MLVVVVEQQSVEHIALVVVELLPEKMVGIAAEEVVAVGDGDVVGDFGRVAVVGGVDERHAERFVEEFEVRSCTLVEQTTLEG